jgi:hypothetical protein
MTGRSSPSRSMPSGIQKVVCSHCSAQNYPTDPICLQCGKATASVNAAAPPRAAEVASPEQPLATAALPRGWNLSRQPNGRYRVTPPVWNQIGWGWLFGLVLAGLLIYFYVADPPQPGQVRKYIWGQEVNHSGFLILGLAALAGTAVRTSRRERWDVGRNYLEQHVSLLGLRCSYRFTDAVFRSRLKRHEHRDEHGVRSVSHTLQLLVTDREKTRTLACSESDQPQVAAFLEQQTGWSGPNHIEADGRLL